MALGHNRDDNEMEQTLTLNYQPFRLPFLPPLLYNKGSPAPLTPLKQTIAPMGGGPKQKFFEDFPSLLPPEKNSCLPFFSPAPTPLSFST